MGQIVIRRFGPSARQILDAALHIAECPSANVVVQAPVASGSTVFGDAKYEKRREKDFERGLAYLHDFAKRVALKPQVFLGGACDPTTWRTDTAIPMLEAAGVAFHNPQVADWDAQDAKLKAEGIAGGILEVEGKEKLTSFVLLFVFDPQTRAIGTLNEAVEFMCSGRQKVVLVASYVVPGQNVGGQVLTAEEAMDLNIARAELFGVAKAKGVPVFQDIGQAVEHCAEVIVEATQDYTVAEVG